MKNLDTARYRVAAVAKATGLTATALRAWIVRGDLPLAASKGDERAEVPGATTLLTLRRCYQIAVAADLARRFKFYPKQGLVCALHFTDVGDAYQEGKSSQRPAGHLYPPDSLTLLIINGPTESRVVRWRPVGEWPITDFFAKGSSSAIVVNLNHLVGEIDKKLGVAECEFALSERVAKVLKGAREAGVAVSRFSVTAKGEIVVFTGQGDGKETRDDTVVVADRLAAMRAKRNG